MVKEGEVEVLYLYDNPDMPPSEELFFDAMKKLVEVVKGNTKIEIIRVATPFAHENYDLLLEMGFSITDVPKDIARFTKTSSVARIDKYEFLNKSVYASKHNENVYF